MCFWAGRRLESSPARRRDIYQGDHLPASIHTAAHPTEGTLDSVQEKSWHRGFLPLLRSRRVKWADSSSSFPFSSSHYSESKLPRKIISAAEDHNKKDRDPHPPPSPPPPPPVPAPKPAEGTTVEVDVDETASEYSELLSNYSWSLVPSMCDCEFKHGRRYHSYHSGAYQFPNDEHEQQRLDLCHHIFYKTLHNRLFLAPIDPSGKRILDLGTGTGIWPHRHGRRVPRGGADRRQRSQPHPAAVGAAQHALRR